MIKKLGFCYDYARPALTVDAAIFTYSGNDLKVLLVQRAEDPFKNRWVFPGGFVNENETIEKAVARELWEETNLRLTKFEQIYTASAQGRDPRGWTISCVFTGFVNWEQAQVTAADDAKDAKWYPLYNTPNLAFDHEDILLILKEHLKKLVRFSIISPVLLPSVFLPEQLEALYFQITGSRDESGNLLQRLIDNFVIVPHTYSNLYTFNMENYKRIIHYGFISS